VKIKAGDLVRHVRWDCIGVVLFVGKESIEVYILSDQNTVWLYPDNLEKLA